MTIVDELRKVQKDFEALRGDQVVWAFNAVYIGDPLAEKAQQALA